MYRSGPGGGFAENKRIVIDNSPDTNTSSLSLVPICREQATSLALWKFFHPSAIQTSTFMMTHLYKSMHSGQDSGVQSWFPKYWELFIDISETSLAFLSGTCTLRSDITVLSI